MSSSAVRATAGFSPSVLYVGCDMDVWYTGARTRTGTYLNSGSCTWELLDSAGASLASGPMPYEADSDGDYRGGIDATTTATLTPNALYAVAITFTSGDSGDYRRLPAAAGYRE